MINISNINDINNIGVIIFKKGEDLMLTYDYPYVSFLCFRYSTVVSFSYLTPPFVGHPEFPNGCYCTTRNQVTAVVKEGFEPSQDTCYSPYLKNYLSPSVYQFRHLTIYSSFQVVNRDLLCTIQDSHILPYL